MLYKENEYVKEFKTKVKKLIENEDKIEVILDETYFYPEGGGQPSDKGLINGVKVTYVYEKNGEIYHVLEGNVDGEVLCEINFERRFDFMQQHTGQHIFSRVFEVEHDADTIGFNMNEEKMTIDINKKLTKDEILNVEKISNELIYKNIAIKNHYTDKEGCREFDLRKQPNIDGEIRIVEVDGYDWCPCCGTHVNFTGEVGIIKINKVEGYKEGHRIEFSCGARVLKEYNYKSEVLTNIAAMFSASIDLVENIVKKQKDDNLRLSKEVKNLMNELVNYKVEKLIINGNKDISEKIEVDFNALKLIATKIVENEGFLVKLVGKDGVVYAKSKDRKENIKEEFSIKLKELNGKGGGNEYFLQGKI